MEESCQCLEKYNLLYFSMEGCFVKKIITGFFVLIVLLIAPTAFAGSLKIIVNGNPVNFVDAEPYINEDGRTMVPIRFISEELGATVSWDQAKQAVNINYKDKQIDIPINEKYFYIDGKQIELDTVAVINNNRTIVPLRFVGEALGANVLWSSATSIVRLSTVDPNLTPTADRSNKYQSAPEMSIDPKKQYIADVTTNRGNFKIKLFAADTPITVNNFVFLARQGFYDGIPFHRIMKDFMIQTGDPLGNGMGGPGYTFNDELPPKLPYDAGIVAMANSGSNTNGSQFFICNGEHAKYLNNAPNYTVFGQVIDGMDVILKISDTPVEKDQRGELSKPMEYIYIEKVTIEEE